MPTAHTEPVKVRRRKQPQQERAKNTVEKLLDVTEQLLDEIGLDAVTTIVIAERASLSVGTVYEYFPNKQSILFALAGRWIATLERVLGANEVEERGFRSWSEWCDSYLNAMFDIYAQERGLVRYYDTLVSVPELRALDLRVDSAMTGYLQRSISIFFPKVNKEALDVLTRMLITIVHNTLRFAVSLPPTAKRKMMDNLHFIVQTLILKTVH